MRYCETSRAGKNCVLVPLGPAPLKPLMAYVTTRSVGMGEELLTTYGCEYWLSATPGAGVELSPPVRSLVREAAACLLASAERVRNDYAHDAAALTRMFKQPSWRAVEQSDGSHRSHKAPMLIARLGMRGVACVRIFAQPTRAFVRRD